MPSEITPLPSGLYIVATPIGNLGDITLRALDVLRAADLIACEDTRQTQKLLNHFAIATRTVSYHEHNERSRSKELIEAVQSGKAVALVSDAGTPVVSDPGGWLIQEAIDAGIPVIPIPGANAALTALIASGLPATEFTFVGFLPEKAGARRTKLEELAAESRTPRTLIFYEAPHRIASTLGDIESVFGPAQRAVLARELTKLYEEFLRGTIAELRATLNERDRIRGEFVLLLDVGRQSPRTGVPAERTSWLDAGGPESSATGPGHWGEELPSGSWEGSPQTRVSVSERIARLQSTEGLDEKDALKRLARELGQSKSELYRELQRERARRK